MLEAYATSSYDSGVWSLNSAPDTYDALVANDINLYLADIDGSAIWLFASHTCNWYSWGALDDTIHANNVALGDNAAPVYTGIVIGAGENLVAVH